MIPRIWKKHGRKFTATRADDDQTLALIKDCYEKTGYVLDPHTAVGMAGAKKMADTQNGSVVLLATAHPAKFPDALEKAINVRPDLPAHLEDLFEREEIMVDMPNDLKTVQDFVRMRV